MLTAASPASAQAIVFDGGGDGSFAGAYVYQSLDITQNQVDGGFWGHPNHHRTGAFGGPGFFAPAARPQRKGVV